MSAFQKGGLAVNAPQGCFLVTALTESVADGSCIIETILAPDVESASVSYQDAFFGALSVIRGCILNKRITQGGMAIDIGRILYIIRSGRPRVDQVTILRWRQPLNNCGGIL